MTHAGTTRADLAHEPTTLRRSWGWTIFFSLLAAFFYVLAVVLPFATPEGKSFWSGLFTAFVLGGAFVHAARTRTYWTCPRCSSKIKSARKYHPQKCEPCGAWVFIKNGRLALVPSGHVNSYPCFVYRLSGSTLQIPDKCCVCLAPARRRENVLVERGRLFSLTTRLSDEIQHALGSIPHCDEHSEGAELKGHVDDMLDLTFRSHTYYREVVEANGGAAVIASIQSR